MVNGVPVTLLQETSYPDNGEIELRVRVPHPVKFALHLRIPGWLESAAAISLNGKALSVPANRRTFASIDRRWRDGDTVQLSLPLDFRIEQVDDKHPNLVALLRGPQMYVALTPETPVLLPGKPQAIDHRASAYTIDSAGGAKAVEMIPFYAVQNEVYTTYLRNNNVPA